jgi:enediyne biosynthesis protein E4
MTRVDRQKSMSTCSYLLLFTLLCFLQCTPEKPSTLFTRLSSDESGVTFVNSITESSRINILSYEYTYNGGGVAAADFNNDGFTDLYFSGNTVSNKLYLNQGKLKFDDVTDVAGVGGRPLWKTGVSAADVNGDGWMDIYVCYSGPELKQPLSNQLFINNGVDKDGNLSFTERASEYKIDAEGTYSTQASFFDYDRDGDLDMFLINHGNHFYSPFINTNKLRNMRHPQFGNRLYRNEMIIDTASGVKPGNYFTEVSSAAGIHGGGINFSLGVSISDVNNDGWPDIFVTNDYEEQDFLYVNNQDGTFRDATKKSFGHISRNGMGTDIADFNNDLKPDLIEVDMWPEDNFRQKLLKGPDDYNRFMLMLDSGFHHQQMRNTLQLNAGTDANGNAIFCEVGQLSGISATDWSWAPLFLDADNDGLKDLFVTNGYLRDFTSMDFLKYTVEDAKRKSEQEGKMLDLYELVSRMPSTKTKDYIFRNNGDLTFTNVAAEWGMDVPNLSFGAAYADLDNDGDLEIISNNTNEEAQIWLNHASEMYPDRGFVSIKLKGPKQNPDGIGAKIFLYTSDQVQMTEQYLTRGFQSSVDPVVHFGTQENTADKIVVVWSDGKESILEKPEINKFITVDYNNSTTAANAPNVSRKQMFANVTDKAGVKFLHQENDFNDFDRQPLLPYQLSRLGCALAKGDVNGDGLDDFFIGGASGQAGALYIQGRDGKFKESNTKPWTAHKVNEDTGATFFDVDSDQDLDLFVVSGGAEFMEGNTSLNDRLYINDGKGNFANVSAQNMLSDRANGSCVAAADYDKDGDIDLYVGGAVKPGAFPLCSPGALLRNDTDKRSKTVKFSVATRDTVNAPLRSPGIVTDVLWTDYNNDSWPDLMITGHWMGIRLFENNKGKLTEIEDTMLSSSTGLWNRITPIDFDKDGDTDYVLGNAGKNLQWNISRANPLIMYAGDFDGDSRIDPVIAFKSNEGTYPVASRDELLSQINSLRKKFINYSQYGNATIDEVLTQDQLKAATVFSLVNTETSIVENLGNGKFRLRALPIAAQISAVTSIVTSDYNNDGKADLLIAGNFYPYRTQYGATDASLGLVLLGDGAGNFKPLSSEDSGLQIMGDVRNATILKTGDGGYYHLFIRNNDVASIYKLK